MNKTTKVILFGALTAGFVFLGCGAEDMENSATAGSSNTAGRVGAAGSPSTVAGAPGIPIAGAPTATAGATSRAGSTGDGTTTTAANDSGCSMTPVTHAHGAVAGLAAALALALASRRRRQSSPSK